MCEKLSVEEKRPIIGEILREKERNALAMDTDCNNNCVYSRGTLNETPSERQVDTSIRQDTDVPNSRTRNDNEDDNDDCLSLFAKESFAEST